MESESFELTSAGLARVAGCSESLVRQYADRGWIECRRASNGVRLFARASAERVEQLKAQRMKQRGRPRRAA